MGSAALRVGARFSVCRRVAAECSQNGLGIRIAVGQILVQLNHPYLPLVFLEVLFTDRRTHGVEVILGRHVVILDSHRNTPFVHGLMLGEQRSSGLFRPAPCVKSPEFYPM